MPLFLATLLNIPGFIERLCKLATRKVSETTGTSSFLQELEEWYTWLDNALVLDALMRVADEETEQSSTGIQDTLKQPFLNLQFLKGSTLKLVPVGHHI